MTFILMSWQIVLYVLRQGKSVQRSIVVCTELLQKMRHYALIRRGGGAHLFAIACKLSLNIGNKGQVQFTAKNGLVSHYKKTLNTKSIDWNIMYIDSYASKRLIEKYFKEECLW